METENRDSVDNESGAEGESPTVEATATIPKKRGRPAKLNAVKKVPTGRGRGRPAKNKPAGEISHPVPAKKEKPAIVATGRGRGRPKKQAKSNAENNGVESVDADSSNDEFEEEIIVSPKQQKASKPVAKLTSPKKAGRPRKVVKKSDDDDDESEEDKEDEEEEERRPIGRPNTGAINLNIERTGRGQGRPKKVVTHKKAESGKRGASTTTDTASPGSGSPKKRGRPSLGPKKEYISTGKPRGRPRAGDVDQKSTGKKNQQDSQDESHDDSENGIEIESIDDSAED